MRQIEDFCCPACKGPLRFQESEYTCLSCANNYPVILDIPDFRVFPDPYIDFEDDHKKATYLAEQYNKLDFMGLVRLYWKITPEVSEDRAERFIKRTAALVEKGNECLSLMESVPERNNITAATSVLEIGCGTGGFLVAAKRKCDYVVGADIAFRWLVVARKRLQELKIDVPLVCCCAEYLPFPDARFDIILAEDVLEHVRCQESTLSECRRVMTHQGMLFLATPNRFSLTPEPHVRVWGVGFLPRKWMNAYVQWVKGISYENIKVLSYMELKKLLNKCQFTKHQILLPSISREEAQYFSPIQRMQLAVYNVVKKIPVLRLALYLVGPFFNVVVFSSRNR
jgi:ubiquinone/menaquinone biosynthesis C-methylase UbiE/uncharacterized protein YbaR (Trm112 family)